MARINNLATIYKGNDIKGWSMYEKIIDKLVNDFLKHKSISSLICDMYGNVAFENELFSMASRCINDSFKCELPIERKAKVVIALTYLASRKYDGNLWDYIRDAFSQTYDKYPNSQFVDGKIRNLLGCFRSFVNYLDEGSYVAVPLVLAGVTHYWLSSFFDFCFLIYKNRMLANGDLSDEQIRKQLFYTFSALKRTNRLSADTDVIKFGESHTYQLSKYTQSALASGDNVDGLVEIGTYCIRLVIDSLLEINPEPKPFYIDAFTKWHNKFSLSKKERDELIEKRKQGVWKSALKYENGINLITKTRWIDDSYDPFSIKILVKNNNEIVQESDVNIDSDDMGALIIKSKRIPLETTPLDHLSYQIVSNDEVLFDSEEELFRDIVFFDSENGAEIFATKDYDGGALVVTNNKPEIGRTVRCGNNYFVTEIIIDSSQDYVFDGKHYGFKTIRKPGIEGVVIEWAIVEPKISSKNIAVYSEVNHALFEAPFDVDSILIEMDGNLVNNDIVELVELSRLSNGICQYRAILKELTPGYHFVRFLSPGKQEISKANFEFVLDPNAKQEVDDDYLTYEIVFLGKRKADFINENDDYVVEVRNIKGLGPCNIKYGLVSILISFDNQHWIRPSERIDFSALKQNNQILYIRTVGLKNIETKNDLGKLEQPQPSKEDALGWKYRTPCGFIYSYSSNGAKRCKLTISNEQEKAEFFIDYVAFVDESKSIVRYESSTRNCYCRFSFTKNKKLKLKFMCDGKALFTKPVVECDEEIRTPVLKAFSIYQIVLTETRGMFGKEIECYRKDFYFSTKNDLVGHVFQIDSVDVFGSTSNYKRRLTGEPVTIKFLRPSGKENDLYYGTIMQRDPYSHYKNNLLTNIGPIQIRVEDEFEGNKLWVYIYDKEDDMLCYNRVKGCIHNSTNDIASRKMEGIERFLIHLRK